MLGLPNGDVPCWYDLSWQPNPAGFVLYVQQDWLQANPIISSKLLLVRAMHANFENLGIWNGEFDARGKKPLGFNGVFENQEWDEHGDEDNSFLRYFGAIPRIRHDKGQCPDCRGSGEDHELNMPCSTCYSQGRIFEYVNLPGYQLAASLCVFLNFAILPERTTHSHLIQLMTVQSLAEHGRGRWMISGAVSDRLTNFLHLIRQDNNLQIRQQAVAGAEEAMKTVWQTMLGEIKDYDQRSFAVEISEEGDFSLTVPGEACCVHPAAFHTDPTKGYEFYTHNPDTVVQQLSLLAGLFSLNQFARQSMKC